MMVMTSSKFLAARVSQKNPINRFFLVVDDSCGYWIRYRKDPPYTIKILGGSHRFSYFMVINAGLARFAGCFASAFFAVADHTGAPQPL
jgi:hypothetical protein